MASRLRSRQFAGGQIIGVEFKVFSANVDRRGCFTEVFQDNWDMCLKPVQWSIVHSKPTVFRGMHLHRRHGEYFAVISGRASVGLKDMRPGSATEGVWSLFDLSGKQLACVAFPFGVLHGWYFREHTIHLQAVSEAYADYHEDDNLGCRWNDPDLGIPWPQKKAILAPRAQGFPSFRELAASLKDSKDPQRVSSEFGRVSRHRN
jgi:dTDP-4-dehydrorhamnose 3,5-epimerase